MTNLDEPEREEYRYRTPWLKDAGTVRDDKKIEDMIARIFLGAAREKSEQLAA